MEISHKLLPNKYDSYWYSTSYNLEEDNIALLIIINLHLDKKINDKKMFSLFKQYNNKTLIRKVNTYHCKINNKWYNDESTLNILIECYHELCTQRNIDIEVMLKYLNFLLNKNKNFCIDFLYFNFFEPLINSINHYNNGYERFNNDVFELLTKTIDTFKDVMSYDEFKETSRATSGYCCSDCSGCLSEYKYSQYQSYLGFNFEEKIEKEIKNNLNQLKTKFAQNNWFYNRLLR